METENRKVTYTLEPHFDAGMFDNTQEEWEKQKAPHSGTLLSWNNETRIGETGKEEVITVGVIEDDDTHEIVTIPKNRIKFV
ncbi:MAG: hypothetical protein K5660_06665 [Paludibacteraceae bacterium]|nr:hypothetical protein [Paludibacteraceae bacterium]